jgi:hypothetical protein
MSTSGVSDATTFPGWEFFAPVAGATLNLLDLLGPTTRVFLEEPAMVKNQGERWWNKVEQRHDRSGIGNLIRPEDIYLSPWDLDDRLRRFSGLELDQLGAVDILDSDQSSLSEVDFATRPTQRFHGSIPALIDAIKASMNQDARVLLTAPNQGEVERLAGAGQLHRLLRIQLPRGRPAHAGHRKDRHRQRRPGARPARRRWPCHRPPDRPLRRQRPLRRSRHPGAAGDAQQVEDLSLRLRLP